jgi:DNA-binding Lrp family transcriptional regulator
MEKYAGEFTEYELMDEVMDALAIPMVEEGELTSKMLQDKTGMSERVANNRLEGLVKKGILKKRRVVVEGHSCNAYFPAEGGWASVLEKLK